jgi:hypothetical protein
MANLMPMLDRELACHHGRAAAMAILHHLQQVASLLGRHRGKSPVVEDQEFDARQGPEKASMAAVAPRECERVDQPQQPLIEHGAVVPAGLVA